jgi:hypothetical protein
LDRTTHAFPTHPAATLDFLPSPSFSEQAFEKYFAKSQGNRLTEPDRTGMPRATNFDPGRRIGPTAVRPAKTFRQKHHSKNGDISERQAGNTRNGRRIACGTD